MANSNKLLVIDCSQLCYNSFYTFENLSYKEKKTGIIFGFLMQIFKLAKDFDTKNFAFCWDSGRSFRKDIYPDYKKKRHNKDELTVEEKQNLKFFHMQKSELRQFVLPKLGFKNNFIKTGYEADDIITWIIDKNNGATIVSNDNDMLQLLDRCEIYHIKTKERIGYDEFTWKYGIEPKQWGEVKAIAGCSGDEVKGIQGAGEPKGDNIRGNKTLAYLRGNLKKGKIFDRIESKEGQKIIKRNRKLVVLPFSKDDNYCNVVFNEKLILEDWLDIFNKYGFNYFQDKKQFVPIRDVFELE